MKLIAIATLLCAAVCLAQTPKEKYKTPGTGGSPPKETSVTLGGKEVWIVYHAPSVKGRKMFGADAEIKPGIWRLGADQATFLHTDADLTIGGVSVPKGEYTLYMDVSASPWKLVISSQTGQWGIKRDGSTTLDESKVVGKAAMTMSKPASLTETLDIALSGSGNKGKLTVKFENFVASVDIAAK
jgi:hypothetical protein